MDARFTINLSVIILQIYRNAFILTGTKSYPSSPSRHETRNIRFEFLSSSTFVMGMAHFTFLAFIKRPSILTYELIRPGAQEIF